MGSQREAMILQDGHSWGLQAKRQPGNGQATIHAVTKIHSLRLNFSKGNALYCSIIALLGIKTTIFFRVIMIIKNLCEDDKLSDKLILK